MSVAKKITMKEIAEKCGVGKSTVLKALFREHPDLYMSGKRRGRRLQM